MYLLEWKLRQKLCFACCLNRIFFLYLSSKFLIERDFCRCFEFNWPFVCVSYANLCSMLSFSENKIYRCRFIYEQNFHLSFCALCFCRRKANRAEKKRKLLFYLSLLCKQRILCSLATKMNSRRKKTIYNSVAWLAWICIYAEY